MYTATVGDLLTLRYTSSERPCQNCGERFRQGDTVWRGPLETATIVNGQPHRKALCLPCAEELGYVEDD